MKIAFAIVLAAAVVGGLAGAATGLALDGGSSSSSTTASAPASQTISTTPARGLTPEQVYARAAPAVVVITDTQTQQLSPSVRENVRALGSGFVIDTRGDIVTNDHVVQGSRGIRVGFSSGATYPATIVGTDPSTDIAVVRVKAPASALRPLQFADSGSLHVGDPAYAVGNPFGLDRTMTAGIVSAMGRDIQAPNGLTIQNAIQTDAPINHGNSGGPLLDRFGRVIGINAQMEGGTVDGNVGVGFAIPSDTARSVVDQLIANGHAEHAWLGVQVEAIDPAVAKVVQSLPEQGVIVARVVPGSPAAKAGLVASTRHVTVDGVGTLVGGDAIVRANGKEVATPQDLAAVVAARQPGDQLQLEVVRSGNSRTVTVTLGDVPPSA